MIFKFSSEYLSIVWIIFCVQYIDIYDSCKSQLGVKFKIKINQDSEI